MTACTEYRRLLGALVTAVLTGVLLCVPAAATEADMDTLPVVEPFLCAVCHVSSTPDQSSFELNPFGDDFLAGGRVWNDTLASADSDDDNCVNGVELGDTDGDGVADGNVTSLQSNPGDGTDCGVNTVDPTTWTELKGLFNRK